MFHWLKTGTEAFHLMLEALSQAKGSIRLETYIFRDSELARRFRDALCAASARGVRVQVIIDALGSHELPNAYWDPLIRNGGQFRWFNPLKLRRLTFRDHRKLLVIDDEMGFIGGFNIGPEYEGDGVSVGWRDLGVRVSGLLARDLAHSFDDMFAKADLEHPWLTRLRRSTARQTVQEDSGQLLLSGPGRGRNGFKRALLHDLSHTRRLRIVSAYFLPTGRFRRAIQRVAKRGGQVQLILPGKTDVALAQLASHAFYFPLMRAGVEIYEYQPQILHTKLVITDDACYVGSSNLDARSLHINYELMARITNREAVEEANRCFDDHLLHSRRVPKEKWVGARTLIAKLKERWAGFVLARLDPWIMRWQLGLLKRTMLANRIKRKLPSPVSPARPA